MDLIPGAGGVKLVVIFVVFRWPVPAYYTTTPLLVVFGGLLPLAWLRNTITPLHHRLVPEVVRRFQLYSHLRRL